MSPQYDGLLSSLRLFKENILKMLTNLGFMKLIRLDFETTWRNDEAELYSSQWKNVASSIQFQVADEVNNGIFSGMVYGAANPKTPAGWFQSNRMHETEEQRQARLDQERKRSAENRKRTKTRRHNFCATNCDQQGIKARFSERSKPKLYVGDHLLDPMQEDNLSQNRGSESLPWPAPISSDVKEALLQKFLGQISMSALEEATCAVCNVRIPVQKSKKLPVSKIPNSHLLQAPEELKDLVKRENQSKTQF